jgi:hypothetical protein
MFWPVEADGGARAIDIEYRRACRLGYVGHYSLHCSVVIASEGGSNPSRGIKKVWIASSLRSSQ